MAEIKDIYTEIDKTRNIIETTKSKQLKRDQTKYLKRLYGYLNEIQRGGVNASRKTDKRV